jgi:hypothetical protein
MAMKRAYPIVCLTLLLFAWAARAGQDLDFPLYHRVSSYHITNTWSVAMSKLAALPGWDEKGELPLAVGKVASLAREWMVSKGGNTSCTIYSVEFRYANIEFGSVSTNVPPVYTSEYRKCWFYIVRLREAFLVGSWATCIVLPDGTVVEPTCLPRVPDSNKNLRYLD